MMHLHNSLPGIDEAPIIDPTKATWLPALQAEDAELKKRGVFFRYNLIHRHWPIKGGEVVLRTLIGCGADEVEIVRPVSEFAEAAGVANSFMAVNGLLLGVLTYRMPPAPKPLTSQDVSGLVAVLKHHNLLDVLGFTLLDQPEDVAPENMLRLELQGEGDRVLDTRLRPLDSVRGELKLTNFSFPQGVQAGKCQSFCHTYCSSWEGRSHTSQHTHAHAS